MQGHFWRANPFILVLINSKGEGKKGTRGNISFVQPDLNIEKIPIKDS